MPELSVLLQPSKEQRRWKVLGGRRALQLLQPKLPAALHPVPADKQQCSLQLRFSDGGAQYLGEGVQRGPAGLLHSHYEIHWYCSIAYLVVRGKSHKNGLRQINQRLPSLQDGNQLPC